MRWAVLAALAACYQPTYDQLACGPADACPSGHACVAGVCARADGTLDAAVDANIDDDGGDATPIDGGDAGAGPDGPATDAVPIDAPTTDAAPVDGSTDAGPPTDGAIIDARPIDAALPVCGNGAIEAGEVCDDGNTITELACPYGPTSDCTFCNATCTATLSFSARYCGNGVQETPEEACDGDAHNAAARAPCCSSDCLLWTCG